MTDIILESGKQNENIIEPMDVFIYWYPQCFSMHDLRNRCLNHARPNKMALDIDYKYTVWFDNDKDEWMIKIEDNRLE